MLFDIFIVDIEVIHVCKAVQLYMQEIPIMQAVTASRLTPRFDEEQAHPISIKELDRKISDIEKRADEVSKIHLKAKQEVYWRAPISCSERNSLHARLHTLKDLISGSHGVYKDFSHIHETSGLVSRMRRIRQVEANCILVEKSLVLVQTVEQNGIRKIYGIISELVEILLQVDNPALSFEQKMRILNKEYLERNLGIAGESPRDIGIELVKLFEMALDRLIVQGQTLLGSDGSVLRLHEMRKTVHDKLYSVENYSPRAEKDHPIYSSIDQDVVDKLLQKAALSKEKFSFWKMLSSWARITSFVRKPGQCEAYGDGMENELGQQIAGIGKKLERKISKIVTGKMSAEKASSIQKTLDVYSNAYMQLKSRLEERRRVIYTLMPDSSFGALLTFAYGLRHELSEIGFLLDVVRDLAHPESMAIFATQAALKKHLKTRQFSLNRTEHMFNDAVSLFQVGKLVRDAKQKDARSEFVPFLARTLDSVTSIYSQCASEMSRAPYAENALWDCLLHSRVLDKSFDVYFVRQMIGVLGQSPHVVPDCSQLLLLSYYKHEANIQEKIQKNMGFASVVAEYEQQCYCWQVADLLPDAHQVLLAIRDLSGKKHDVRAYAKAAELHMEFSRKTYANEKVHAGLSNMLYSKLCECTIKESYPNYRTVMGTHSVMLFEMLACCLYGTNEHQIQAAQDYVSKACEDTNFSASDDIMLLVYENTINKVLSSSCVIGEKELIRLIDGPITSFIKTGETGLDKAKLQLVIDTLLIKEQALPDNMRKVTRCVALLERK